MDSLISIKQFRRWNYGAKTFIWNDIEEKKENIITEKNGMESVGEFGFTDLDSVFRDSEEDQFIWNEINSDGLVRNKINQKITENILKYFQEEFLKHEIVFLKNKKIDEKTVETSKIIEKALKASNNNKLIFQPVFQYKNCIAQPLFYDCNAKSFGILTSGPTSKKALYIDLFWIYQIMKKANYEIKEIFLISPKFYDYHETEKISFSKINRCNVNKTFAFSASDQKKLKFARKSANYFAVKNNLYLEVIEKKVNFTILEMFENKTGKLNPKSTQIKKFVANWIYAFDDILYEIRTSQALKTSNYIKDFDFDFFFKSFLPDRKLLNLYYSKIRDWKPKIPGFIFNMNKMISSWVYQKIKSRKFGSYFTKLIHLRLKLFESPTIQIQKTAVLSLINCLKKSRVVWYDFEGFSMPFSVVPHFMPYHQIVFQCSVIKTNNYQEIFKENLLFDPQNFQAQKNFQKIIDSVYDKNADYYVVYNKSYELVRFQEMINFFHLIKMQPKKVNKENHAAYQQEISTINHYAKKVATIIEKTVDLMDLFAHRSYSNLPKIFIPQVFGSYSIKSFEKFISQTPVLQSHAKIRHIYPYQNLDVQNGTQAMMCAIKRYLNVTKNQVWQQEVISLKKYCENDVRAMIMVADLAFLLAFDEQKRTLPLPIEYH